MRVTKSTMVELVQELESVDTKAMSHTDKQLLAETIKEAKAGEYHDYKNEKYICGKVEVVSRLDLLGFHSISDRVMNGEFDEEMDEADKKEMKTWLPKDMWEMMNL